MPQTRVSYIDSKIQYGRGRAAQVLGQPYNVYRRTDVTNGSVLSGPPVYTGYPLRLRETHRRDAIEGQNFGLLVFEGMSDNRGLVLGDTLVETGKGSRSSNIYTFAQARPTRESLFFRTETNVAITRPMPTAGQAAQLPPAGAVIIEGYGGYQKDTEQVLTLTNGFYAFSGLSGAQPASIQCGIQQLNRVRDGKDPKWPTVAYREHFLAFIPPTPGEELSEKDTINAGNGDRYVIMSILQVPNAGFEGWVCICERKAV